MFFLTLTMILFQDDSNSMVGTLLFHDTSESLNWPIGVSKTVIQSMGRYMASKQKKQHHF